jgi:dGTPase
VLECGVQAPGAAKLDVAGNQSRRVGTTSPYIAGMTDRYAIREHRRIFSIDEL